MKRKLVLPALFSFCMGFGFAQNTIRPGSPEIKTERIRPAHAFYKNVITGADGRLLYEFMMENYQWLDSAKQQWVFARYRQVPRGFFSTDTSFTDVYLKPVRMHEIHYQQQVDLDMRFAPQLATVVTNRKGRITMKNYSMNPGYFEDNMIEYIFGYLELKKGVTYTMDNFNPATPGSDPFILKYTGDQHNRRIISFTHGDTKGEIWVDPVTNKIWRQEGQSPKWHYIVTKQ